MVIRTRTLTATAQTVLLFLSIAATTTTPAQTVHILFDATKGEMAGNADWVVDYDQTNLRYGPSAYLSTSGNQSNPQQIPTPAQTGITLSSSETYWSGALSSWAIDCVNKGYVVETLPYNGQITYNNTSNPQDLSHYQVYIVDEPNIQFTAAEKTALMLFVQNGGGLFMISDHSGSDRNSDGWDSPAIWNDFLSTNSVKPYPFGIYFDLTDFSQTTTNISATPMDSIIHGPMGNVTEAQWAGGTTLTLDPTKNATVKGVIFRTGSVPGNTNAMVAYARYGNGRVAAIGDSSPTDDGTGNPTCTLYNGYWSDASGKHRLLLMNITIWLATQNHPTATSLLSSETNCISVFPNPSNGTVNIATIAPLTNTVITICDLSGKEIKRWKMQLLDNSNPYSFSLKKGFYFVRVESDQLVQTSKINVD